VVLGRADKASRTSAGITLISDHAFRAFWGAADEASKE
jgi:hypothetical protein